MTKLIKSLLPIFRVYQFCGFSPFSIPFDLKKGILPAGQKKWYLYNGLLIVCLIAMILYNFIGFRKFIVGGRSEMLTYLSVVIAMVVRMAMLVITIESLTSRKLQMEFLIRFDTIRHHFRTELDTDFDYKKIRQNTYFWS